MRIKALFQNKMTPILSVVAVIFAGSVSTAGTTADLLRGIRLPAGFSIPKYGRKRKCSAFTPAAMELGAHVAALGMRFYTGRMFPETYRKEKNS